MKQNREVKLAQLAVVDSEHKKEIARSAYYPLIRNESKLNHITLSDVGSVFTFAFYRRHLKAARNKFIFASSK